MNNAEILKRISVLEITRTNAMGLWNDIERYILPLSSGSFFAKQYNESQKNWFATREVWDSTAPIGAERLASFMWSSLISNSFRWFGIGYRIAAVNQDTEARRWMDDTAGRMFDTLSASNLALEFASNCLDLVGYGNACLTQEMASADGWEGFEFSATPMREIFFEEDYRGRVYRFYRIFSWTATQMVSKFTDKDGTIRVPDRIKEKAAGNASDEKMEVVFCVYPRPDKKAMSLSEKMRAPLERPFGYKYVLRDGAETLGEEGGVYETNSYVMRWAKTVGSQWGFGPGSLALPTVKLLNALQEEIVNAAQKVVDPATLVTERGLLSDLDLDAGGLTTVRSLEDIGPYESKARFDVSDKVLTNHQMMVRKFFREDDIGLKESPAMTATETMQRVELMNRLFGAPVARIQNDGFDPTIQTTFNTMWREGQIDKPPQIIQDAAAKGAGMQIQYHGPFARAMRADEVSALERLSAAVAAMKKMEFPEAGDAIKPGQIVREMADRLGCPASVLATVQEAKAAAEQRSQQQQQMAQAQIAKTQGEARRAHATADMNQQDAAGGASA